jgi:O-antigen ligase
MINAFYSIPIIQRWQRIGYRPILRVFVVAGVLLFAAAASFVASETLSLLLIGLPVGIGVVLLFLRHPALGILAIIPASFIIPIEIGVSSGSSLNAPMLLIILMTGLWLIDMVVIKRQLSFSTSKTMVPLVALIVIVILSFINGQLPWFAFASKAPITAQIGGVALFVLSASVFLIAAHQIKNITWLKWMTWVYLGLGIMFFLMQVIPGLKLYSFRIYSYGSLTSLFWTWMVALSFGQALYNNKLLPWQRAGLILLTVVTLYFAYTLIDGWKSGWVPALAVIITLIILKSPKLAVFIVIGALIAAPIFILALIATDQYSYETRLEAWFLIGQIVKVSPILGLGPANYYWYTPLFPIRGYAVQFNSHNQFVDLVAQIGLLGLLAFLWVMFEIGNLGLKLREAAPEGFAKAYVFCALGGLAGMIVAAMLGDWVLPFVYNVGFTGFRSALFGWLFLGGLVALEKIIEKGNT